MELGTLLEIQLYYIYNSIIQLKDVPEVQPHQNFNF